MSRLYFGYRELISGPARRLLDGDQSAWLRRRMSCGNDIRCIAMAYRDRVVYLHQHSPAVCDGPVLTQPAGCDPGGSSEITDEDIVVGSDQRGIPIPEVKIKGSTIFVPLRGENGTYVVPVAINRAITLNFVVDSGAADVSIPLDVFSTLVRTGTLQDKDLIGTKDYKLADGSTVSLPTFRIRSLILGSWEIENVTGSVAPVKGALLLGQSFLSRFKSWSVDNTRQVLVLEGVPEQAAWPSVQSQPPPHLPKQWDVKLTCAPALIANALDPVTSITVWLKVVGDTTPQIEYFDTWHHTAKGNTYKRSKQYADRHLRIPDVDQPKWFWEGRWKRDSSIYMTGQLTMTNGLYTYQEWKSQGNSAPQDREEEITSSVCKEAKE